MEEMLNFWTAPNEWAQNLIEWTALSAEDVFFLRRYLETYGFFSAFDETQLSTLIAMLSDEGLPIDIIIEVLGKMETTIKAGEPINTARLKDISACIDSELRVSDLKYISRGRCPVCGKIVNLGQAIPRECACDEVTMPFRNCKGRIEYTETGLCQGCIDNRDGIQD